MKWSALRFFAGSTPMAVLVSGLVGVQPASNEPHICELLGWPRNAQASEQRTVTLQDQHMVGSFIVDGPVAIMTLQPSQLRRASILAGAGIVAFGLETSDGAPPLLVLDVGFMLQHQQRTKQAS